jgi:hypothetical protein
MPKDMKGDDSLSMNDLFGGEGHDLAIEDGDGDNDEKASHEAAASLIDAIHSKDAKGVASSFKTLCMYMQPPGEDDMNMTPDLADDEGGQ